MHASALTIKMLKFNKFCYTFPLQGNVYLGFLSHVYDLQTRKKTA